MTDHLRRAQELILQAERLQTASWEQAIAVAQVHALLAVAEALRNIDPVRSP